MCYCSYKSKNLLKPFCNLAACLNYVWKYGGFFFFLGGRKKLNEIFEIFLKKWLHQMQKTFHQKKTHQLPSPIPQCIKFEIMEFWIWRIFWFLKSSPQENEDQVGTGWHVMQLSGKQMQCTIVALVALMLGNYIIYRNVEIFKYIYFIIEKKFVKEK
jgi:hypothetical protein